MKKIVILILSLLFLPSIVLATNDVNFDADTRIEFDSGIVLIVASGSVADEMVVNPANVQFTLSANSSVTITCAGRNILSNTLGISTDCSGVSSITLPGQSTQTTVTVTPSTSQTCPSTSGPSSTTVATGGGGAAPTTPSVPTTSTGQVTATASAGGKTTLTTDENTTAAVELPANAVTASTDIQVTNEAKETAISSRPIPSNKTVIGSYIYDYAATANGETISSFDKTITLTFTYTDDQISGLDESSLKVYYWKEDTSQWVALSTLVFAATNTLTATTDHFTYFAILGSLVGQEEEEEVVEEAAEVTINEGDIIRNPNAEGLAQFDIYIVKLVGSKKFKRLILSPHVFESYEHLRWQDVKDVSQSVMNEYTASDLVRAQGDAKVYKLTADGDTGTKQWLNMSTDGFVERGYDWDSIYLINTTDRDAYTTGTKITGPGASEETGAASQTIIIKTSTLRMRSLPSLEGDILSNVHQGEVYELLDEQAGWYKITANGVTGWCYGGDTGGYAAKQ